MDNSDRVTKLAKNAKSVQSACNLGAVALGLHKVVNELRELGITNTDELNQHPIVVMWVDKLSSLCGLQLMTHEELSSIYNSVDYLAKE